MKKIQNLNIPQEMVSELMVKGIEGFNDKDTLSFNLIGINRLQSTLVCMLKASYVQQSQRYVKNTYDSFEDIAFTEPLLNETYRELITRTMDLYDRMTEIKEESKNKSRTTKSDYKHGIPIEDARYCLPLSAKTNVAITTSGRQFLDFLLLLDAYKQTIFKDLYNEISEYLNRIEVGEKILSQLNGTPLKNRLFANNVKELLSVKSENRIEVDQEGINNIAIATLTSTSEDPIQKIEEKYTSLDKKERLINRVSGYGHTSILEHYRFNSVMKCSLVTFHQLIRHRLVHIEPLAFDNLMSLTLNRHHVVPDTIKSSKFYDEYMELVNEYKAFTNTVISKGYLNHYALLLLLNGDEVVFNYATNIRADIEIMNQRLCTNAQWEIRRLMAKRKAILKTTELGFIYNKFALPDCALPIGCQEGAYSCGKPQKEEVTE